MKEYTGAAEGKDVLNIDLKGVTERYIRIRNLEKKPTWAKFSEFTVKQKVDQTGTTENIYTNVKDHGMLGTTEAGGVFFACLERSV